MSRSDLLTEARDYANRRAGTVPGDLVLRLVIELETAAAERDAAVRDLDAGFAESDHLSAKYYQRMRDAEALAGCFAAAVRDVFEQAHAKELDTSTAPAKNGADSLHVDHAHTPTECLDYGRTDGGCDRIMDAPASDEPIAYAVYGRVTGNLKYVEILDAEEVAERAEFYDVVPLSRRSEVPEPQAEPTADPWPTDEAWDRTLDDYREAGWEGDDPADWERMFWEAGFRQGVAALRTAFQEGENRG